jgi:hypothetical protein
VGRTGRQGAALFRTDWPVPGIGAGASRASPASSRWLLSLRSWVPCPVSRRCALVSLELVRGRRPPARDRHPRRRVCRADSPGRHYIQDRRRPVRPCNCARPAVRRAWTFRARDQQGGIRQERCGPTGRRARDQRMRMRMRVAGSQPVPVHAARLGDRGDGVGCR